MSISIRNSVATALAFVLSAGCGGPAERSVTAPDIPYDSLQTADLAFRLGRSVESEMIASYDEGMRYSHVGVVIRCDSAEDFFRSDRAAAGAVMRLSGLNDIQRTAIRDYALRLRDSQIVFDHDYSLADSTRMYCTELVERAFAAAGISLSQGRRHRFPLTREPVILPSDMARNASLSTITAFTAKK